MENVSTFYFVNECFMYYCQLICYLILFFFWIEKEEKHEESDSTDSESVMKVVEEIVGIEMETDKFLVSVLII